MGSHVDVARAKATAFVISTAYAGIGGALTARAYGRVAPDVFTPATRRSRRCSTMFVLPCSELRSRRDGYAVGMIEAGPTFDAAPPG